MRETYKESWRRRRKKERNGREVGEEADIYMLEDGATAARNRLSAGCQMNLFSFAKNDDF
jgi:DNA repair exonuclease SbcCD ATPase subunit